MRAKAYLEHWIGLGIRIFRVDNPHTKPFAFWEWLLPTVQARHPDVIFLAEAFTTTEAHGQARRDRVQPELHVLHLAHVQTRVHRVPRGGGSRSQGRLHAAELLAQHARHTQRPASQRRAGRRSSSVWFWRPPRSPSYGIYSGYELCENEPFSDVNEEYLHSEKYEIKHRDFDAPGSLADFITRVNDIRRRHRALRSSTTSRSTTRTTSGSSPTRSTPTTTADVVLVVVNLDPFADPRGHALASTSSTLGHPSRTRPTRRTTN